MWSNSSIGCCTLIVVLLLGIFSFSSQGKRTAKRNIKLHICTNFSKDDFSQNDQNGTEHLLSCEKKMLGSNSTGYVDKTASNSLWSTLLQRKTAPPVDDATTTMPMIKLEREESGVLLEDKVFSLESELNATRNGELISSLEKKRFEERIAALEAENSDLKKGSASIATAATGSLLTTDESSSGKRQGDRESPESNVITISGAHEHELQLSERRLAATMKKLDEAYRKEKTYEATIARLESEKKSLARRLEQATATTATTTASQQDPGGGPDNSNSMTIAQLKERIHSFSETQKNAVSKITRLETENAELRDRTHRLASSTTRNVNSDSSSSTGNHDSSCSCGDSRDNDSSGGSSSGSGSSGGSRSSSSSAGYYHDGHSNKNRAAGGAAVSKTPMRFRIPYFGWILAETIIFWSAIASMFVMAIVTSVVFHWCSGRGGGEGEGGANVIMDEDFAAAAMELINGDSSSGGGVGEPEEVRQPQHQQQQYPVDDNDELYTYEDEGLGFDGDNDDDDDGDNVNGVSTWGAIGAEDGFQPEEEDGEEGETAVLGGTIDDLSATMMIDNQGTGTSNSTSRAQEKIVELISVMEALSRQFARNAAAAAAAEEGAEGADYNDNNDAEDAATVSGTTAAGGGGNNEAEEEGEDDFQPEEVEEEEEEEEESSLNFQSWGSVSHQQPKQQHQKSSNGSGGRTATAATTDATAGSGSVNVVRTTVSGSSSNNFTSTSESQASSHIGARATDAAAGGGSSHGQMTLTDTIIVPASSSFSIVPAPLSSSMSSKRRSIAPPTNHTAATTTAAATASSMEDLIVENNGLRSQVSTLESQVSQLSDDLGTCNLKCMQLFQSTSNHPGLAKPNMAIDDDASNVPSSPFHLPQQEQQQQSLKDKDDLLRESFDTARMLQTKISKLESQCATADSDYNALHDQLDKQYEQLQEAEKHLKEVKSESEKNLKDAENNLAKLNAFLSEKTETVRVLELQVESLKQQLLGEEQWAKGAGDAIMGEVSSLTDRLGESAQELGRTKGALSQAQEDILALKKTIVALHGDDEKKDARHAAAVHQLQCTIESLQLEIVNTEVHRDIAEETAKIAQTALSDGMQSAGTLAESFNALKHRVATEGYAYKNEIGSAKARVESLQEELHHLHGQLDDSTLELTSTRASLSSEQSKVSQLESSLSRLREELKKQEEAHLAALKKAATASETVTAEAAGLRAHLEAWMVEYNKAKADLDQKVQKIAELEAEVAALKEQVREKEVRLLGEVARSSRIENSLQSLSAGLRAQLLLSEQTNIDLESMLHDERRKSAANQTALSALTKEIEAREDYHIIDMGKMRTASDELRQQLDEMRTALEVSQKDLAAAHQATLTTTSEQSSTHAQTQASLTASFEAAKKECTHLHVTLTKKEEQCEHLSSRVEALQKSLEDNQVAFKTIMDNSKSMEGIMSQQISDLSALLSASEHASSSSEATLLEEGRKAAALAAATVSSLQQQLAEQRSQVAVLTISLAESMKAVEATKISHQTSEESSMQRISDLTAQLAAAAQSVSSAEAMLSVEQQKVRELEACVLSLQESLADDRAEIGVLKVRLSDSTVLLNEATSSGDDLKARLAAAGQACSAAEVALLEERRQAAELTASVCSLQESLSEEKARNIVTVGDLRAEIDTLKATILESSQREEEKSMALEGTLKSFEELQGKMKLQQIELGVTRAIEQALREELEAAVNFSSSVVRKEEERKEKEETEKRDREEEEKEGEKEEEEETEKRDREEEEKEGEKEEEEETEKKIPVKANQELLSKCNQLKQQLLDAQSSFELFQKAVEEKESGWERLEAQKDEETKTQISSLAARNAELQAHLEALLLAVEKEQQKKSSGVLVSPPPPTAATAGDVDVASVAAASGMDSQSLLPSSSLSTSSACSTPHCEVDATKDTTSPVVVVATGSAYGRTYMPAPSPLFESASPSLSLDINNNSSSSCGLGSLSPDQEGGSGFNSSTSTEGQLKAALQRLAAATVAVDRLEQENASLRSNNNNNQQQQQQQQLQSSAQKNPQRSLSVVYHLSEVRTVNGSTVNGSGNNGSGSAASPIRASFGIQRPRRESFTSNGSDTNLTDRQSVCSSPATPTPTTTTTMGAAMDTDMHFELSSELEENVRELVKTKVDLANTRSMLDEALHTIAVYEGRVKSKSVISGCTGTVTGTGTATPTGTSTRTSRSGSAVSVSFDDYSSPMESPDLSASVAALASHSLRRSWSSSSPASGSSTSTTSSFSSPTSTSLSQTQSPPAPRRNTITGTGAGGDDNTTPYSMIPKSSSGVGFTGGAVRTLRAQTLQHQQPPKPAAPPSRGMGLGSMVAGLGMNISASIDVRKELRARSGGTSAVAGTWGVFSSGSNGRSPAAGGSTTSSRRSSVSSIPSPKTSPRGGKAASPAAAASSSTDSDEPAWGDFSSSGSGSNSKGGILQALGIKKKP